VNADVRAQWVRGVAGLAAGAAAGAVCSWLRTPIPWMLGPLVTVAFLRVAGARVGSPPGGRQAGQWIIGTALGLYFTPQVVREVAGWWWLLAVGAAFAIALGYGGGVLLARLAGIDRTTGVFASVPGGAAEMSVLGERFGARADRVAAAQSLRILIVVLLVPFAYAALGLHGTDAYAPGATRFDAAGFALLMGGTFAGSALAQRLDVPNAFVLGSLAVAIPLTALSVDLSTMPAVASNAGQCLLGCALGARFEPDFLAGAHRFVAAVAASVLAAIAVSVGAALLLAALTGLVPATVVLGMAPGGIAEMCITAKVLQLGVPLVTAFHVTRVVALLLLTAPLFERAQALKRRRRAREGS
jgi:membrane AbrB-like protein